jgi:hypothetical protein
MYKVFKIKDRWKKKSGFTTNFYHYKEPPDRRLFCFLEGDRRIAIAIPRKRTEGPKLHLRRLGLIEQEGTQVILLKAQTRPSAFPANSSPIDDH